jgi:hypothetical protein
MWRCVLRFAAGYVIDIIVFLGGAPLELASHDYQTVLDELTSRRVLPWPDLLIGSVPTRQPFRRPPRGDFDLGGHDRPAAQARWGLLGLGMALGTSIRPPLPSGLERVPAGIGALDLAS